MEIAEQIDPFVIERDEKNFAKARQAPLMGTNARRASRRKGELGLAFNPNLFGDGHVWKASRGDDRSICGGYPGERVGRVHSA